ncbi:MAG: hypothetical protein JWN78_1276 [Bacteroidota bacterium]|nr:hypothetical protein [Bacteroidota bacterium]
MNKLLHDVVFISLFSLTWIQSYGQNNRVIEVSKTSVNSDLSPAKTYPNIEEKKTAPVQLSNGKISPAHGRQLVLTNSSNTIPSQRITPANPSTNREEIIKEKMIKEGLVREVATKDQTTFPDLKVTASREPPYQGDFVLKEKNPEQMVSVKPVNTEDAASKNTNNTDPDNFTISPLKRKYFESRVSELEKEIQQDPKNTSADMRAKKKELQELKKLLAH